MCSSSTTSQQAQKASDSPAGVAERRTRARRRLAQLAGQHLARPRVRERRRFERSDPSRSASSGQAGARRSPWMSMAWSRPAARCARQLGVRTCERRSARPRAEERRAPDSPPRCWPIEPGERWSERRRDLRSAEPCRGSRRDSVIAPSPMKRIGRACQQRRPRVAAYAPAAAPRRRDRAGRVRRRVRAPRTLRRAARPSRPRSAAIRIARRRRASASSADTGTIRGRRAIASPCIVAMPTRRPVKDPGPAATANRSMSSMLTPRRGERSHQLAGQPLAVRARPGRPRARRQRRRRRADGNAARAGRRVERRAIQSRSNQSAAMLLLATQSMSLHQRFRCLPPVSSEPAGATPAMRQYFEAKRQYRDAIVFFRMGDFYEMFYEDALTAARALELTLTSRSKDSTGGAIPMCGVPYHAADGYIARLVKKGFRVAVCEQMEDPKKAKGLVRREVVARRLARHADRRRLSRCARAGVPRWASRRPLPGRATASRCSISRPANSPTAEYTGADARQALADELAVLRPREIVAPDGIRRRGALVDELRLGARVTAADAGRSSSSRRGGRCSSSCSAQTLAGLRPRRSSGGDVRAAGALVQYLRDTQKADLAHVREIAFRTGADCLHRSIRRRCGTSRSIEAADGGRTGSLLHEIDRTITPMGGRLLRGVAAAAAGRARAHPGSARRGRGVRVPHAPSAPRCARR